MRYGLLILCLLSSVSLSHKVVTLIDAVGLLIEGQIGFSNGAIAQQGTPVDVFRNGEKVDTVIVDGLGHFRYDAKHVADYTFIADMGSGHVAKMEVSAVELSGPAHKKKGSAAVNRRQGDGQCEADIEQVVARQIRPLRQDILALSERRQLMDLVGGIGFIVGLFGFIAWRQARRREHGVIRQRSR